MFGQNIKLYSWVDIQDQLLEVLEKDEWLDGVKVEIIRSSLYVFHRQNITEPQIRNWLKIWFPNALKEEGISLESLGNGQRFLPIYFEEVEEDELITPSFIPSFSRPKAISFYNEKPIERSENADPVMIAAHSFKGGVGRTLHTLALTAALEDRDPDSKILLIDADFEAPGITWMTSNPEIAFVDLLNLIHSSTDPFSVVPAIADDLQNQLSGNVFFLPAFRTERQLRSLEIKPEHIFRFAENPFIISDVIAQLAKKLNAKYVLIDLRAGISELSANWLLDSRVANIFVTTLNSQSVEGTLIILDLLAQHQQDYGLYSKDIPAIIISQVNPDQIHILKQIWNKEEETGSSTAGQNVGRLRNAFSSYLSQTGFEEEDALVIVSPLYDSLLVLPNNWDDIRELIKKSGLFDNISPIALSYQIPSSETFLPEDEISIAREKMLERVPDLIYAEKHLPPGFYQSQPIRNLANRHRTRLPNLVVVGAKGAGKTFLFRQILRNRNWKSFLGEALGEQVFAPVIDAKIIQVTIPEAIEHKTEVWIKKVKPYLLDKLAQDGNLNTWRSVWLEVMAWSYGFQNDSEDVGDAFIKHLIQQKKQVIFLFDGLEDLFPEYYQNTRQQIAMRALLQDVQSYISVTPNAPIGIIVFIRRDMIEHIIKQNLGQFIDRHKEFALKWDRTEALRLVAWVISYYEIFNLPNLPQATIPKAHEETLTQALFSLWGRKLGSDQSREARSAKNILGKLSNFNEEVQSRDLIRFLAEAIKQELGGTSTFKDRILGPKAIRDAFPEVGKEKVREVKEENKNNRFEEVLEKLEQLSPKIKVPFESTAELSSEDISLLIEQGVLKRHEDKYYMAELFRLGLGIDKRKGKVKTEFSD